jgi:hypothetical protein
MSHGRVPIGTVPFWQARGTNSVTTGANVVVDRETRCGREPRSANRLSSVRSTGPCRDAQLVEKALGLLLVPDSGSVVLDRLVLRSEAVRAGVQPRRRLVAAVAEFQATEDVLDPGLPDRRPAHAAESEGSLGRRVNSPDRRRPERPAQGLPGQPRSSSRRSTGSRSNGAASPTMTCSAPAARYSSTRETSEASR